MFEQTTGVPAANASVSTMPKLSPPSDGAHRTSDSWSSLNFSCSVTRPSTRTPSVSSRNGSTSSRVEPAIVRDARTPVARSASKARSRTGSPLRSSARPTNASRNSSERGFGPPGAAARSTPLGMIR